MLFGVQVSVGLWDELAQWRLEFFERPHLDYTVVVQLLGEDGQLVREPARREEYGYVLNF